jgi:hypothetical protein
MHVQLATLCDSASDYNGKLCLLGAFDTLCSREFPVVHPQCSLVVRLTFEPADVGRHQFRISCVDPGGQECLPPFEPVIDVAFPSNFAPFVTRNIVLNLQQLRIERQGLYRWIIQMAGETLTTIPLRVTLFDEARSATGPAG